MATQTSWANPCPGDGRETVVLDALCKALSQDMAVMKPAEKQLQTWEIQPGFYSTLLSIVSARQLDSNVRFLAAVYFKNGIDRYWRRNAPNALSEEEKTQLRAQVVKSFDEPVLQIATQLSVLIGKIARLDCPRNWPELVPILCDAVRIEDDIQQRQALLTFYTVVKALASKRLAPDRKVFEQLTANIFEFMVTLWNGNCDRYSEAFQQGNTDLCMLTLDRVIITLKILRKLVVFGYPGINHNDLPLQFLQLVFQKIDQFLLSKGDIPQISQRRQKILVNLTKVLLDFQSHHPDAFVCFISTSLEMTKHYCFLSNYQDAVYERFLVNLMNLLRAILRCELYRPSKNIQDTKDPLTIEAHKLKTAFFTMDNLSLLCQKLITHYFLLNEDDLQTWDNDPENFANDDAGDSWRFSLSPCTENLYLTLMKEYRQTLTDIVLQLVRQHQNPVDEQDLQAILTKDAVYNAVGLASFDLYDSIDFDIWLREHLVTELSIKHANYRIVQRRVVWLIGQWVGVKIPVSSRPLLYENFSPLLLPSQDLVVRIETATTLKSAVDDFDFSPDQYLPYLKTHFELLFALLQQVSECETKMQILHVISFVIERMERLVQPYSSALVSYLPQLWEESRNHDLLRCAILSTLTNLVQGLGVHSLEMHPFLLSVIQISTDVTQPPHIYLNEDGLDLWMNTLHCSPQLSPGISDLYLNIPPQLELGTENLKTCLKIIEAYLYTDPAQFLQRHGEGLVSSLSTLYNDVKAEGIVMIYKVIELSIRVLPADSPNLFSRMLPDVLQGLLRNKDIPMIVAMQLSIISRLLIHNPQFFWSFLSAVGAQHNTEPTLLLGEILDVWFDSLDNIVQVERKKLSTLALVSLLDTLPLPLMDRFGGIVGACVETLHDVCRSDVEEGKYVDSLIMESVGDNHQFETEHVRRKYEAKRKDPVHTVSLGDFVTQSLSGLQRKLTPEQWQQLIDSVDFEILGQLNTLLGINISQSA